MVDKDYATALHERCLEIRICRAEKRLELILKICLLYGVTMTLLRIVEITLQRF